MTVSDEIDRNGDGYTVRQLPQSLARSEVEKLEALQLSKPFG